MAAQVNLPTPDERLTAALAHFFGLFVALVVWVTQKDKSRFVRLQATQAIAFDMLFLLLFSAGVGILVGLGVLAVTIGMAVALWIGPDQGVAMGLLAPALGMPLLFGVIWLPLVMGGMATTLVRLIAAVRVFQGHDFRYPWLGRRVEAFLNGS